MIVRGDFRIELSLPGNAPAWPITFERRGAPVDYGPAITTSRLFTDSYHWAVGKLDLEIEAGNILVLRCHQPAWYRSVEISIRNLVMATPGVLCGVTSLPPTLHDGTVTQSIAHTSRELTIRYESSETIYFPPGTSRFQLHALSLCAPPPTTECRLAASNAQAPISNITVADKSSSSRPR